MGSQAGPTSISSLKKMKFLLSCLLLAPLVFAENPEAGFWTADAGIVPNKIPEVPALPLTLIWPTYLNMINSTVATEEIVEPPIIGWEGAEGDESLYTLMIADYGMFGQLGGGQYFHGLVNNIPGNDVSQATQVFEYVAPFGFVRNATNTGVVDVGPEEPIHDILALLFRQPGPIEMEEFQAGCEPGILGGRISDSMGLAAKYGLEGPVAGTFFWSTYTEITKEYFCQFTLCTGEPFPFPIPGLTDQPECNAA